MSGFKAETPWSFWIQRTIVFVVMVTASFAFLLVAAGPIIVPLLAINGALGKVASGEIGIFHTIDKYASKGMNVFVDHYNQFHNYSNEFAPVYNQLVKGVRMQYLKIKSHWDVKTMSAKLQSIEAVREKATDVGIHLFNYVETWMGDAVVLLDNSITQILGLGKIELFNIFLSAKDLFVQIQPILMKLMGLVQRLAGVLVLGFDAISAPIERMISHITAKTSYYKDKKRLSYVPSSLDGIEVCFEEGFFFISLEIKKNNF